METGEFQAAKPWGIIAFPAAIGIILSYVMILQKFIRPCHRQIGLGETPNIERMETESLFCDGLICYFMTAFSAESDPVHSHFLTFHILSLPL